MTRSDCADVQSRRVPPGARIDEEQREGRCGYLPLVIMLIGTAAIFYGAIAVVVWKFI